MPPVSRIISNWWDRRRRNIDLKILWPSCKAKAPSLDYARAAFAVHAFHDPAWLSLGEEEVAKIIDRLE